MIEQASLLIYPKYTVTILPTLNGKHVNDLICKNIRILTNSIHESTPFKQMKHILVHQMNETMTPLALYT